MKRDPANHEKKYKTWQDKINGKIPDISKANSDIILKYINDMENGVNISIASAKGGRSYARLNNIRQRMIWFAKKFNEVFDIDNITKVSEEQLLVFFNYMKNGTSASDSEITGYSVLQAEDMDAAVEMLKNIRMCNWQRVVLSKSLKLCQCQSNILKLLIKMKIIKVEYTVKKEYIEENKRKIKIFMDELRNIKSPHIKYSSSILDNGRTFLHILFRNSEKDNDLPMSLELFKSFQASLKENVEVPKKVENFEVIDSSYDIF